MKVRSSVRRICSNCKIIKRRGVLRVICHLASLTGQLDRMLSEHELCSICGAGGRDDTQLCVVESPADVMAIEDATGFRGHYFVLMGHLSPLDGIGPQELGLTTLEQRLAEGGIDEMIIATNPTVEGDATAHYLADLAARNGVEASRIAHGVPLGGELEYVDGGTLSHAFYGRRVVDQAK